MATGPGDELEAAGQGHLRASHADCEQAIDTLKIAFIQGRITRDELDLRVGRTLASRTYGDLAALTADIPARLTRVRAAEPARESADKKKKAVVALACATPAIPGLRRSMGDRPYKISLDGRARRRVLSGSARDGGPLAGQQPVRTPVAG